jgi:acylglycerol lipase
METIMASGVALPAFIPHGTAHQATMPAGSQCYYDTSGSRDKTLKHYEGLFHDLPNDVGKEIAMAEIRAWIDDRLPG